MTPVCVAWPPLIVDPCALIPPAPIPIPALLDTYFTIAPAVALMLSKLSPDSISTHELNCQIAVLTPAITGVGKDISNLLTLS